MATRTSVTPLYVIAGAGDLAVEKFREVRGDVTSRFAKLDQKTVQTTLQTELTKRQAEFVPLREGEIDWLEVYKALGEIGYKGSATVELPGGDKDYLREVSRRFDLILSGS